jgi:hypothetical protein
MFDFEGKRSGRRPCRTLRSTRDVVAPMIGGAPTKSKELTGVLIFGVIGLTPLQ